MVNSTFENQQNGESAFVAVPLNDIVMQICEGIVKMRKSTVNPYDESELICQLAGENRMFLDLKELNAEEKEAKQSIRPSQVQLFMFLLYSWRKAFDTEFSLDLAEYYAFRGIERRTVNNQRLYEDLDMLRSLSIDMDGKNTKGRQKIYRASGQLLQYQKEGRKIRIIMGDWIENLSEKKFTQLHQNFFMYHAKKESNAILLSLKLAQLVTLHRNKVKIGTLLQLLGVSEEQLKKQGCKYYAQLLEKAFELLKTEGYVFRILSVVHDDVNRFKEMNVIFHNGYLSEGDCNSSNGEQNSPLDSKIS